MPFHLQFFANSTKNLTVYTKKAFVKDALMRLLVTRKCLLIHLNFEAIKLSIKTEGQNVHLKDASHPKPDQTLKPNHIKILENNIAKLIW